MADAVAQLCERFRVKPETVARWKRRAAEAFAVLCLSVISPEDPTISGQNFALKDAIVEAADAGALDGLVDVIMDAEGNLVREERILPKTLVSVYHAIADRAPGCVSYVSVAWIAFRCQCDERTVRRAIDWLERLQWIARFDRWRSDERVHRYPGYSASYRTTVTVLRDPRQPSERSQQRRVAAKRAAAAAPAAGDATAPSSPAESPPLSTSASPAAPSPPPLPPRIAPYRPKDAEAIFKELRAHPHLAELGTKQNAFDIDKAAQSAGVPFEATAIALRQLAGKVAAGTAKATLSVAVGFVVRMVASPVPEPPLQRPGQAAPAPATATRHHAADLEQLRREGDAERERRAAAQRALGLEPPHPSTWGALPASGAGTPPPPALASLAARAEELDGEAPPDSARAPPDSER